MLNSATPEFVAGLAAAFGPDLERVETAPYLSEPRGRLQGQGAVLAPHSTAQVAGIVAACASARVGLVPYSGGTGLVGGQILTDGPRPVVMSLERMNRIRDIYPSENVLIAEAGVILADVQAAAKSIDRLFPLSLASQGSARIGGLLATNAGGVNVLRYGNARAQCLGLEVVTASGAVWHGLTRLRKDNTGYDLRDLMIGSEGSLGIITAAALKLSPLPHDTGVALLVVPSPDAALQLLALAGAMLGEGISAFELMHRQGFDFLSEVGPQIQAPFAQTPEWSVLIEVGLPAGIAPQSALESLFEAAIGAQFVLDGVIAQSHTQAQALWAIRENIPEANRRIGSVSSHDISVPLSAVPEFIDRAPGILAQIGQFRINCFGHLGDGNLHYNVFPLIGEDRHAHDAKRSAVKTAIHDLVQGYGGSVSAEHGIGRLKVADLETYADPVKLDLMRAVKRGLDPDGILNPGAVLRQG